MKIEGPTGARTERRLTKPRHPNAVFVVGVSPPVLVFVDLGGR